MDYSLLVGLHFRDDISASKMGFSSPSKLMILISLFYMQLGRYDPPDLIIMLPLCYVSENSGKRESLQGGGIMSEFRFSEWGWKDVDRILHGRYVMTFNSLTCI